MESVCRSGISRAASTSLHCSDGTAPRSRFRHRFATRTRTRATSRTTSCFTVIRVPTPSIRTTAHCGAPCSWDGRCSISSLSSKAFTSRSFHATWWVICRTNSRFCSSQTWPGTSCRARVRMRIGLERRMSPARSSSACTSNAFATSC